MCRGICCLLALLLPVTAGGQQARSDSGKESGGSREGCDESALSMIAGLEDGKTAGLIRRQCVPEAEQTLASIRECLTKDPAQAEASEKPLQEVEKDLRSLALQVQQAKTLLHAAAVQDKLKAEYKAKKLAQAEWPPAELCRSCAVLWEAFHDSIGSPEIGLEHRAGRPCVSLEAAVKAEDKERARAERLCEALRRTARLQLDADLGRLRYYSWTATGQVLIAFWREARSMKLEAWCAP